MVLISNKITDGIKITKIFILSTNLFKTITIIYVLALSE